MFDAKITFRPSPALVLFLALRNRRRSMGVPFSLQSKQLQPDYVSSYSGIYIDYLYFSINDFGKPQFISHIKNLVYF